MGGTDEISSFATIHTARQTRDERLGAWPGFLFCYSLNYRVPLNRAFNASILKPTRPRIIEFDLISNAAIKVVRFRA